MSFRLQLSRSTNTDFLTEKSPLALFQYLQIDNFFTMKVEYDLTGFDNKNKFNYRITSG